MCEYRIDFKRGFKGDPASLFWRFGLTPLCAGQSSLVTFVVVLSKYLLKPMPSSVVDTQLVTSVQSHTLAESYAC